MVACFPVSSGRSTNRLAGPVCLRVVRPLSHSSKTTTTNSPKNSERIAQCQAQICVTEAIMSVGLSLFLSQTLTFMWSTGLNPREQITAGTGSRVLGIRGLKLQMRGLKLINTLSKWLLSYTLLIPFGRFVPLDPFQLFKSNSCFEAKGHCRSDWQIHLWWWFAGQRTSRFNRFKAGIHFSWKVNVFK